MTTFEYSAVDGSGNTRSGRIDAATRQGAIAALTGQRLYVTRLLEAAAARGGGVGEAEGGAKPRAAGVPTIGRQRVGAKQVAALWGQLATALEAGLPLLTALRVVREQSDHAAMNELVSDLARRVEGGEALSDALAAHPRTFTPLQISMARAGETAGVLDGVMASLAEFSERDLAIREQVRSASVYPAIVLSLAVLSVIVIVTFILPNIMESIGTDPSMLPLPTRLLLGVSWFIKWFGWAVAIGIGIAVWRFRVYTATPEGRLVYDRARLRIPVVGGLLRKVAVARFARALGTLTNAGIQVVEALHVVRGTVGNEAMAQVIDDVRQRVIGGASLEEPLRDSGQFPPLFIQVVSLGEKTGKLDDLLLKVAESLDKDVQTAVQRAMTVLPAVFIVALAILIGFILAAVLLPIVGMGGQLG